MGVVRVGGVHRGGRGRERGREVRDVREQAVREGRNVDGGAGTARAAVNWGGGGSTTEGRGEEAEHKLEQQYRSEGWYGFNPPISEHCITQPPTCGSRAPCRTGSPPG